MRQISQANAHTCNFLMRTIFYLQLHALFCKFYSRFLLNIIIYDILAETKAYKFNLLYKVF